MSSVILVTGSRQGLVASSLAAALPGGCALRYLTRHPREEGDYAWDLQRGLLDEKSLDGVTHIVHLAGAPLNGKRWTASYREEIIASRVKGPQLLRQALMARGQKLEAYISASAVGYYGGVAGEKPLDETAGAGSDFLAQVCRAWEHEAQEFELLGLAAREVRLRFGVVFHPTKGALPLMLLMSWTGIYMVLGSGRQPVVWIDHRDLGRMLAMAVAAPWRGAYNAVVPVQCGYRELIGCVRKLRHGWLTLRMPAWVLKALMGSASSVVLEGAPVSSQKAQSAGFQFRYPTIEACLDAAES